LFAACAVRRYESENLRAQLRSGFTGQLSTFSHADDRVACQRRIAASGLALAAPRRLIIVGAMTNGIFNPANSTAMISMMPKEHRGFASAMNHLTFGFGNVFGVAFGGLCVSLAFEFHSGIKAAALTAENPAGFVAALNTTFVAAIVLCVAGVFTSASRDSTKVA